MCAATGPGLTGGHDWRRISRNSGLDAPQTAAEIPCGTSETKDEPRGRRSLPRKKKTGTKKRFKPGGKQTGGSGAEVTVFWSSLLSIPGLHRGAGTQERGTKETRNFFETHLIENKHGTRDTEIAGYRNTH